MFVALRFVNCHDKVLPNSILKFWLKLGNKNDLDEIQAKLLIAATIYVTWF